MTGPTWTKSSHFWRSSPHSGPETPWGGSSNVDSLADQPFESDAAEANGTSIAVPAEFGDRAVLLGADAYAPVLEASIARLLKERRIKRLRVHLFKVPHHGSAGNVSIDLLEKLDCGNYLVSTNGKRYRHPDRDAIARIVRCGRQPVIHFNYRSEFSGFWDDEALGQGIEYQANYPATDGEEGCVIDVAALPP